MVDTARSMDAILALLADNTEQDITPQNIRDLVLSVIPAIGGMHITGTPVATTFSDSVTPVKALGTTELSSGESFDMPENNRLRYTADPNRIAVFTAGISISAASSNEDSVMSVAKNGTVITDSVAPRKIGTGSDIGRAVVLGITTLNTNDYLECFVLNSTDTTSITYEALTMHVLAYIH